VIGTHAVARARFRNLATVVIDEEQRFGEGHKRALRSQGDRAHTLIMTATPLPRTLQGALLGSWESVCWPSHRPAACRYEAWQFRPIRWLSAQP
jgi:transcription-repair coupling factor (superfamily II helicase)